ncbi:MAG: hypothetical protein K8R77_12150 [Anaerolineaceae bacterium]|nr:hypothetical protein [Anaerolineaceae bacterium]
MNIDENDVETMRYILEHGCLPGESEPAPVVIAGYPQEMIDAAILALEELGILETALIKNSECETIWHKPAGLTPLGRELLLELGEPQTRKSILAAFTAAGNVPYKKLIQVWYRGHRTALQQMRVNKQAWVSFALLLVFVLITLARLLPHPQSLIPNP